MKKISFIVVLLSALLTTTFAQLTNEVVGARAIGSANASINYTDVWAAHNNIAGLAEFKGTQVGAGFNNRFGVSGFNTMSLAAAHQIGETTTALTIKRFGDNLYNESVIGIGAAHRLDFVSLGLKANILQVAIDELGSKTNVALEFGGLVHVNDEITVGANIFNLNQAKIANYNDERFSTVLKAGLTYHPSDKLFATIEAEKDVEYKHNVKVGLEYFVIEKLAVRTGFSTLNQNISFGLGLKLNKFDIDYALSYHNQLGVSNAISLGYIINKGKEEITE